MRAPAVAILGLGRGVGIACARRFAEAKWSVIIVDGDQKNLDRAEDDLGELCHYLHEDQSTRLGLKNALAGTLEQCDGVDLVLHIPPLPEPALLDDLDLSRFARDLTATATTSLMAAQIFGREMVSEIEAHELNTERPPYSKSFLQILSRAAISADTGYVSQSVTQGAVLSVMKAIAVEFTDMPIRSNAIVATRPRSEDTEVWLRHRTPLGRSAKAREIADAAFFLASSEASYITGHALVLDGGRSVLNGLVGDPGAD